jgi:NAD(P)H dehydrogenase (quinone)
MKAYHFWTDPSLGRPPNISQKGKERRKSLLQSYHRRPSAIGTIMCSRQFTKGESPSASERAASWYGSRRRLRSGGLRPSRRVEFCGCFASAGRRHVAFARARGGHCDLNVEGFDPVLSRQDRVDYKNTTLRRTRVAPYVARLLAAEALLLIFLVWNEGFPATMKGFFDSVFLPGVSLDKEADGSCMRNLTNITRHAAVCTYGLDHLRTMLAGDPPRRVVKRTLRSLIGQHASCDYLAPYDMNHSTSQRRATFLNKVTHVFEAW